MNNEKRETRRRELALIFLLLLLGVMCMLLSGARATRLAPFWSLDTDIRSQINPDKILVNDQLVNPILPEIMTRPAWMSSFLTPYTSTPGVAPTQMVGTAEIQMTLAQLTAVQATNVQMTVAPMTNVAGTQVANTQIADTQIAATLNAPTLLPPPPWNPPPTKKEEDEDPIFDLSISITDGSDYYIPNSLIIYHVIVANSGTGDLVGVEVSAAFPSVNANDWGWDCEVESRASGCNYTGFYTGDFSDTVDIQAGGYIAYALYVHSGSSPGGYLTLLAVNVNVELPPGYVDSAPSNNDATDTDLLALSADLAIVSINDGVSSYVPGQTLTYTIVVENHGSSDVNGAVFTNNKPTQIESWTWTCVQEFGATDADCPGTPSSANFKDVVNLPIGGKITYTVTAKVIADPRYHMTNRAEIAVPNGYYEKDWDQSKEDKDNANVDLKITKNHIGTTNDGINYFVTWEIKVENPLGPFTASMALILDIKPYNVTEWTWTCEHFNGAKDCDPEKPIVATTSNNYEDNITLPPGGYIIFTVEAKVPISYTDVSNTAQIVVAPYYYIETAPGDNTSTNGKTLP